MDPKHSDFCCLTKEAFDKNDPVPLKSVSVDVRIEGYIANVRSTLCFNNVEKNPIEARFEFPMDDQSTVYHFEAQIEDRIIIAECQEKEQAMETYEDAVKAGFGAVLMQEADFTSDIFSCRVGNLPPDAEAVIKFGYVTELSLQPDGTLSFLLPTLLNPRYNPSLESGGSKTPLDPAYNTVRGEKPKNFEVKISFASSGKVVSVKSPNDNWNVKFIDDKSEAKVTLGKSSVIGHGVTVGFMLNERKKPFVKEDDVKAGGSKSPLDVTYVPVGGEHPYKFDIRVTIVNPGKIFSVKSPKDELNVKLSDDKTEAQVTLAKPFVADHDLTLDVMFEELNKPHLIIEKGDDTKDGILKKDIVMLNFFPELKDTDYTNKHEFIFVVDRSGSMDGQRIREAREALLLFLKSLPPGCYFNVVGFGSTFQLLFPDGSQEYSEESLKAACEHQQVMDADLGGTEILEPLKHIYDKPPMTTHSREILLLTDGAVANTDAVIDLVKKNASNTRLFSIGIGEGASTSLVKGIARAGRGKAEFIKDGERLQPLVVKTLKAAMQLAVTDLLLDWQFEGGSVDLIQMPKDLPPLFAGERLIIYNVTSADKPLLNGKVQLKGQIGERSLEFGLDLDASENSFSKDETMPIHRLAAKAQIKQLQDAGKDENKTSIVLLSTAANVISCHTSMVGIDKNRTEKVTGELVRRNVPMMTDPSLRSAMACQNAPGQMSMGMPRSAKIARMERPRGAACCDTCRKNIPWHFGMPTNCVHMRLLGGSRESLKEELPEEPPKELTYMTVVALQAFSGLWKLSAELAAALKTTLDALQNSSPIKEMDVWATVLALSCLEVKYEDKRDEWEMVEMKARQWLDLQDREGLSIDDLLQKAKAVVGRL